MERNAIAPDAVLTASVRTPLGLGDVFAALARDGAASVWSDPAGGSGFVGFAAADEDPLVLGAGDADAFAAGIRARLKRGPRVDSSVLGWWGWLSYELGVAAAGLPIAADAPPTSFAFIDRGVRSSGRPGELELMVLGHAPDAERWLETTARRIEALQEVPHRRPSERRRPWRWRHDRSAYLQRIAACQAEIRRGDAYQLCLTDTISAAGDELLDPLEVYCSLRASTPTAHCGVLRVHDRWLISASPERFLTIDRAGRAITRPMKGTRPRATDPAADRALAEELLASEKERAENLMIVDLMRNDLSRVSQVGSVSVPELFRVESYGVSHQLVSTVESQLEADPVDAVLALFPPGSMTGAPKHAAMRLLGELEAGPRGLYSGAWGRLSLDGSVDLAVVIRSVVIGPDGIRIGTGGGITALSVPEEEWEEIVLKARPMLLAIGAEPDGT